MRETSHRIPVCLFLMGILIAGNSNSEEIQPKESSVRLESEREKYELLVKNPSPNGVSTFLNEYPNGEYTGQVRKAQEELQTIYDALDDYWSTKAFYINHPSSLWNPDWIFREMVRRDTLVTADPARAIAEGDLVVLQYLVEKKPQGIDPTKVQNILDERVAAHQKAKAPEIKFAISSKKESKLKIKQGGIASISGIGQTASTFSDTIEVNLINVQAPEGITLFLEDISNSKKSTFEVNYNYRCKLIVGRTIPPGVYSITGTLSPYDQATWRKMQATETGDHVLSRSDFEISVSVTVEEGPELTADDSYLQFILARRSKLQQETLLKTAFEKQRMMSKKVTQALNNKSSMKEINKIRKEQIRLSNELSLMNRDMIIQNTALEDLGRANDPKMAAIARWCLAAVRSSF